MIVEDSRSRIIDDSAHTAGSASQNIEGDSEEDFQEGYNIHQNNNKVKYIIPTYAKHSNPQDLSLASISDIVANTIGLVS